MLLEQWLTVALGGAILDFHKRSPWTHGDSDTQVKSVLDTTHTVTWLGYLSFNWHCLKFPFSVPLLMPYLWSIKIVHHLQGLSHSTLRQEAFPVSCTKKWFLPLQILHVNSHHRLLCTVIWELVFPLLPNCEAPKERAENHILPCIMHGSLSNSAELFMSR